MQVTPSASCAVPCGQAASAAEAASDVWHSEQSDSIVQFTGWPSMAPAPPASAPLLAELSGAEPPSCDSAFGAHPVSSHNAAAKASTTASTPAAPSTAARRFR